MLTELVNLVLACLQYQLSDEWFPSDIVHILIQVLGAVCIFCAHNQHVVIFAVDDAGVYLFQSDSLQQSSAQLVWVLLACPRSTTHECDMAMSPEAFVLDLISGKLRVAEESCRFLH